MFLFGEFTIYDTSGEASVCSLGDFGGWGVWAIAGVWARHEILHHVIRASGVFLLHCYSISYHFLPETPFVQITVT